MELPADRVAALIAAATAVRARAYAPYSNYQVGAALVDESGRVHVGTNVENVAYGSTLCAERAAVLAMVSSGGRHIHALAVVTIDGGNPCGACLQVIAEFASAETEIVLATPNGPTDVAPFHTFLPHGFDSQAVRRT
jgi:cytidine deaminase